MEEWGKLEEEKGGTGWAASVVLCHYTRSQHALYVGIWDRAWQVRAELKAIEHHAKTTACVFKSQKPNGHIIVRSFSHTHRRESIYREKETPFDWKINRFTVHRWGDNIKNVPLQWVHRCCSLGFVFHYLFSAFLFSGVERWSRLEWTHVAGKPQWETAREGQRDKGGVRHYWVWQTFTLVRFQCLYIHTYIFAMFQNWKSPLRCDHINETCRLVKFWRSTVHSYSEITSKRSHFILVNTKLLTCSKFNTL